MSRDDSSARFWANALEGTYTLYKDIPISGLFSLKKDSEDVYEKLKTGFRYADRSKRGFFKTGQRTAVHRR